MMGAEPLEVPHQSNNSQNQNNNNSKSVDSTYQGTNEGQQNSLLIPSSTSIEEGCWEVTLQTQHNTRSNSNNSNGGQSSSTNSTSNSNSNSKGPRRTRHRVDAGEPRGCFNSANNPSFAFQPRNIFTSPQHNNSIGPLGSNSNLNSVRSPLNSNSLLSPYHPHHPHQHHQVQQHLAGFTSPLHNISHNFFGGSGGAQLPPQSQGQGQDAYYFQPMKMLSEFITSQQAAAAAAAAATGISQGTGPSTPTTTNAGSGVVNGQTQHQLLLREMLSKSRNNNNNNNVVTKCGYEDEVVLDNEKSVLIGGEIVKEVGGDDDENNSGGILGADESEEDEEIKLVKIENSLGTEGSKSGLGSAGGHSNSNGHLNNVNNTNVNANSTSSSVTSNCSTGGNSGMRINGCKKRKLYQPQQRSDFEEVDDEEEVDEEDYDSNVLVEAAAMARSGRLNTKDSSSPPPSRSSPLTSGQLQGQVVQPQLPIEEDLEDEEEEMQRMLIKTDRTDYDDDQFDDEEDEDDLSNTNNNNNNNNKEDLRVHSSSATAAPLTRQLLTERNVSKEGRKGTGNSLSLLRTSSSSPKLMLHNSGLNHLRRREHHHNNISQSEENHFMHQRESILPVGANPAAYFYQWKENFKSTLISHITDLVDNQFSLLFPSGTNPNNNNNNNNNNVNSNRTSSTPSSVQTPPNQHNGPRESPIRTVDKLSRGENQHQNQHQQQEKVLPQQHKNPASLLLNGGTVCNNNNREREMCSPPPEKIPRLDLNQGRGNNNNKNEYFPRFPFGVSGNIPNQGGRGDQIQREREQQIKTHQQHQQNFSSALMGLSQAAQLQHHQAAAAAAAAINAAEMFENDGPLSLVVSRQHDQMTPRKKRHKVTDTRLTPRAVSRLLGQVDNYGGDLSGGSPSRGDVPRTPPPGNGPPSLPTSVAIANPSLSDSARLFTPYAHPLFGHHGGIQPGGNHHRLGSSPPMGASLIHPALLANPAEYVQQLRAEMQNEQNQRNGDLLRGEGGRGDHVRAVRDSGSSLISGRPGSAGSDSGETNSFGGDLPGSMYSCSATSHSSSSTLTPMHLRKAKLMFFWVRYPSSSVIKMYFPDIKFNKNNTAQLVKWFSNFREFYYIQMEKYARQALSEGIKNAEELHVTIDNELYRVLNLHYNRNNHIEVPTNFRFVVEQTLREFFKAIQQGKDQEQSWKKAIYKIIARLDDPVPEYFKSPNFLEQLE